MAARRRAPGVEPEHSETARQSAWDTRSVVEVSPPARWRTPEEITEVAFQRSRLILVNEAHDGLRRCVRAREVGIRIATTAAELGVRRLAMEALFDRTLTERANRDRRLPEIGAGYLSQPEMRQLIEHALGLDWTLISYEADMARDGRRWREYQTRVVENPRRASALEDLDRGETHGLDKKLDPRRPNVRRLPD